jgi:hypothetical protein
LKEECKEFKPLTTYPSASFPAPQNTVVMSFFAEWTALNVRTDKFGYAIPLTVFLCAVQND